MMHDGTSGPESMALGTFIGQPPLRVGNALDPTRRWDSVNARRY
jgi:hypothetical protein